MYFNGKKMFLLVLSLMKVLEPEFQGRKSSLWELFKSGWALLSPFSKATEEIFFPFLLYINFGIGLHTKVKYKILLKLRFLIEIVNRNSNLSTQWALWLLKECQILKPGHQNQIICSGHKSNSEFLSFVCWLIFVEIYKKSESSPKYTKA